MQIWTSFLAGDLNAVAADCCRAQPDDRCPDPPKAHRCPVLVDMPMIDERMPLPHMFMRRYVRFALLAPGSLRAILTGAPQRTEYRIPIDHCDRLR